MAWQWDQKPASVTTFPLNQWTHVAFTKSGSSVKTYVNGIEYHRITLDPIRLGTPASLDGLINVGGDPYEGNYFDGRIDEVQFWNTALSQNEISDWMYSEVDDKHLKYNNLVYYYKLNEGTGTSTVSDANGMYNGTMVNMSEAAWVDSDIKGWITDEDTPVSGYLFGTYPSGYVYELVSNGLKGTAVITGANQFTYTPAANENGSDTFTYKVRDAEGNYSNTQSVNITIDPVNDPPGQPGLFVSPTVGQTVPAGSSVSVSWGAAADIENDLLTYTVDFYNGSSWIENVYSGTDTSFTYTSPAGINTMKAKFRVKASDAASSAIFRESSEFTIDTAQYTLKYIAGAGGRISGITTQTVSQGNSGTEVTAVADQGYHFVQWNDGKTEASRTDTNVTGDISVTAIFAINQYKVTFKNWDGSILKTETVRYGSAATAPLVPDREGYTSTGWDSAFSNVTSDLTVTAVFEIKSYNVIYHANGATAGTVPASSSHEYKSAVTVAANSGNLAKAGYSFAGWNTKADGTGTNYVAGTDTFTMGASDVNLYARWTANTDTPYTVKHYQQNIEDNGYTLKESENLKGTTDTTAVAAAKDYTGFTENTTHSDRVASGNITADGSLILSLYYDRNTYTVSFDSNGGSEVDEISGVRYEAKITEPKDSDRTGYTFDDWHKDAGLSTAWDFASDKVTADTTLFARWNLITYIISYELDEGTNYNDAPTSYTVESETITLGTPTKDGYTFDGWYDASTGGSKVTQIAEGSTGDVTLYARWDLITYSISYNLNGGTNYNDAPSSYTVESETIVLGTPIKNGYTFAGWYDASTGGSQVTQITEGSTGDVTLYARWIANIDTPYTVNHYQQDIEGDSYTLKETDNLKGTTDTTADAAAKDYTGFSENTTHSDRVASGVITADGSLILNLYYDRSTYTVSFDTNGGSTVKEISGIRYEAKVTAPAAPVRSGYNFTDWYFDSSFNAKFNFTIAITEDITLYAKWKKQSSYEAPGSGSPASGIEVLVNDKAEQDGKASINEEGGKTVITITVDEKKLEQRLEKENKNAVVAINVTAKADVFVTQLNGQMVNVMESKGAVLEIKTEGAAYILPAQQVNIDVVSEHIGKSVDLKDIKVQIQIAKSAGEKARSVEELLKNDEFTVVVPPVEFTVRCIYKNKIIEVNSFSSYVERIIAIPRGYDPAKITTGVIIEPDGTLGHVPTKVVVIDGRYYAKINSLTNSTYSVIWHPREFKDAASHWAKADINDLGSRLIVDGTDRNTYQPDTAITRAEFAAILVRALGIKTSPERRTFTDVRVSDWYYESIETAAAYHLISGYGQGQFGPLDKITREQAMVIINNAMKITGLETDVQAEQLEELLTAYADSGKASKWARSSIAINLQAGIVTGKPGKMIAPQDEITRAEVAVIIRKLLQKSDLI